MPCNPIFAEGEISQQNTSSFAHDKNSYHLLNPTPRNLLRPLSSDRPDQTESPYTVDAGHIQLEVDAVNALFDRDRFGDRNLKTRELTIGGINLKFGLLPQADVQFLIDTHVRSREEDLSAYLPQDPSEEMTSPVEKASRFGDVVTRLKINLWGNDAGKSALAIMPFFKWPLAESDLRNGQLEGGIIIPLAVELPLAFGLGAQTEFDFVSKEEKKYEVEYFNTVTLSRALYGPLGSYVEFAARAFSNKNIKWQGQMDLGFTLALNDNAQIDLGCNFGVTKSAPDFNPFTGFTWRY